MATDNFVTACIYRIDFRQCETWN